METTTCYRCHQSGHFASKCPLKKQANIPNTNPTKQIKEDTKSSEKNLNSAALQIVDIGVNLGHRSFAPDLDSVIDRAIKKGVTPLIVTGVSIKSSIESQKLASEKNNKLGKRLLYSTVGVHPHEARTCNEKTISIMQDLILKSEEVVAVGECGLDFNRMFSPQSVQEHWFEKQLQLAIAIASEFQKHTPKRLPLPLFLHERDAHSSFVNIYKKYQKDLVTSGVQAVVHCFTGTKEEAEEYVKLGLFIGFTGTICQKERGRKLREILSSGLIPLNKIMIETDAPFMLPATHLSQSKRNEPSFLPYVLETLAQCYKEPIETVAAATTENALKFFNLQN